LADSLSSAVTDRGYNNPDTITGQWGSLKAYNIGLRRVFRGLLKVRVRQLFSQTTAFSADFKKFRDAVKSDLKYRHPENAIETIPRPLMRKNNPFLVQEETLAPAFV